MVTVESGVGGDVEMAADTGAGTVGVGKRSIDEEGDEQERYAKRARESVEVGLLVRLVFRRLVFRSGASFVG
jgi:hypothetical protein